MGASAQRPQEVAAHLEDLAIWRPGQARRRRCQAEQDFRDGSANIRICCVLPELKTQLLPQWLQSLSRRASPCLPRSRRLDLMWRILAILPSWTRNVQHIRRQLLVVQPETVQSWWGFSITNGESLSLLRHPTAEPVELDSRGIAGVSEEHCTGWQRRWTVSHFRHRGQQLRTPRLVHERPPWSFSLRASQDRPGRLPPHLVGPRLAALDLQATCLTGTPTWRSGGNLSLESGCAGAWFCGVRQPGN
jgi:hypothetical protein